MPRNPEVDRRRMSALAPLLIDARTLAGDGGATVLDASWIYPPFNAAGIDVRQRWAEAHIPGSRFLDLAALSPPLARAVADVSAIAPPSRATLRAVLRRAGIEPTARLVVTDQDGGTTTAPFARLALLDAGFADVRLLAGGTPAWVAAGLPLTADAPRILDGPRADDGVAEGRFVGTAATAAALRDGSARVVDARFVADNAAVLPARFRDVAIPAQAVLRPGEVTAETAEGARFRDGRAVAALARSRGLEPSDAVITTCHFGMGAAVVATALELAGHAHVRVDRDSLIGWAQPHPSSG